VRTIWDEVVFLDADTSIAATRAIARDEELLGGDAPARRAHAVRYGPACRIYLAEQRPRERASVLIEHSDPAAPWIVRLGTARTGEAASLTR
jgi:uridine kinase